MNSYIKLPDGGVIAKSAVISITKHEANRALNWPDRMVIRFRAGSDYVSFDCSGEEREKLLRDLVHQLEEEG